MYNIISLGGSLFSTAEGIDAIFLKDFRELIIEEVNRGKKFIIVTGGGALARQYINAGSQIIELSDNKKDWLGIYATRLNAELARISFEDSAYPQVVKNPRVIQTKYPIIIASGWKPGHSTDLVAAKYATLFKSSTIYNLSNITYVYTADPARDPNAKPIKNISWRDLQKIVGTRWTPGLNMPFDPIAAKMCAKHKIKAIILNGKNLKNVQKCFNNQAFQGTIIGA